MRKLTSLLPTRLVVKPRRRRLRYLFIPRISLLVERWQKRRRTSCYEAELVRTLPDVHVLLVRVHQSHMLPTFLDVVHILLEVLWRGRSLVGEMSGVIVSGGSREDGKRGGSRLCVRWKEESRRIGRLELERDVVGRSGKEERRGEGRSRRNADVTVQDSSLRKDDAHCHNPWASTL